MTRIHLGVIVLLAAFMVAGGLCGSVNAGRSTGPTSEDLEDLSKDFGMDPAKCDAVQKQINQVMAVYQSNLTDDEKVASLTQLWSKSAAAMEKSTSDDPDVASTANQYLVMMKELVAMAKDSPNDSDKNVSAAAANSLKKLKTLTQNYVKMMKVMCPKLVLPPLMNQ